MRCKLHIHEKPVIALNKKLISEDKGIDLSEALDKASKEVGGFGGGHPVAAGASIPKGSEGEFIAALDRILGEQNAI